MCSYQQVNNSYGCQNSKLLNGLLKDELDFQGFVMSDWQAQMAGVDNVSCSGEDAPGVNILADPFLCRLSRAST